MKLNFKDMPIIRVANIASIYFLSLSIKKLYCPTDLQASAL